MCSIKMELVSLVLYPAWLLKNINFTNLKYDFLCLDIFRFGKKKYIHNCLPWSIFALWLRVYTSLYVLFKLQQFSSFMTRVTLIKSIKISSMMCLIQLLMSLGCIWYYQYWQISSICGFFLYKDLWLLKTRVTLIKSFLRSSCI